MNIIWFDHLFFGIVGIALPIMSVMTEKSSPNDKIETMEDSEIIALPPKKHIYYTNGLILLIGALVVLTLWNVTYRSFTVLGINQPIIDDLVLIMCTGLLSLYAIDTIIQYVKCKKGTANIDHISDVMPTTWNDFGHFIFLAFAAGICEEIVYRGFLINYLYQVLPAGEKATIGVLVIPALIFALSHFYQGIVAVVKIFAISILFGGIYIFSKSLLLVCCIHVLVDLISGAMMVVISTDQPSKK